MSEIAHLGPVELLTPRAEESLRFFEDVLGMEVEGRAGGSVYLRGWGDYQRYSLKLTESETSGMARARAARVEPGGARAARRRDRAGGPRRGLDRRASAGVARDTASRDPDGHPFEIYFETERYEPPEHLRPSLKNQPQRYTGRGAAVKRLDHVNVLAADVRPNRVFATDVLGYRLYERIELDDGTETGAWMSATIAAHELIYTKDAYGARGRLHHLAFWVDTREECLRAADLFLDHDIEIEAAPSKHAIAQGFFLYGIEPGGNRIEVTTGGYLVYDPQQPPVVWTEAERRRGQAWGVKTVESFHTYGTPPVEAPAAHGS